MSFNIRNELKNFLFTLVFIILAVAVPLTLAGCSSSTVRAQQKVRDIALHLPEYQEAVLIERVDGVRGGSDPKCWTAYSVTLYGTSKDFETILSFYTKSLPALGWRESQFSGLFRRPDGVSLEILTEHDVWASLAVDLEIRQQSQQRFATIYFVSLAYGNPESKAYCQR